MLQVSFAMAAFLCALNPSSFVQPALRPNLQPAPIQMSLGLGQVTWYLTTDEISGTTDERIAFLLDKGVEESVIASVAKNIALPEAAAPPAAAPGPPAEAIELASKLNPVLGFWDPLGLATADFWSKGNDFTWGWLRQAEIKHGRVSMAAFVGFCVQANGIHFPFDLQPGGTAAYEVGLSPPEQWDALPFEAKVQIILFVGFLEWWSEFAPETHYTKGGKPGAYPDWAGLKGSPNLVPPPFPLYDPFGLSKSRSEEAKASGLLTDNNNGRLAMIGIMGFMAAEKVPGSVPALEGILKPYAGDVMIPF